MHSQRYLLFAVFTLAGPAASAGAPAPLTLCFEDVAQRPWSTPGATGLNFELLRRVEKQLGEHFVYKSKPWRRCLEELRLGAVDAAIGTAYSQERRSIAVFPMLRNGDADPARALYTDNAYVFLRVGGNASWDGSELVAPGGAVAVQSGYVTGELLRKRGFRPRELVKSADDGLRLLVSGMYDIAILQGKEASYLVRTDARFQHRVLQASLPYAAIDCHLAFGRAAYARDPRRAEAIWQSIAAERRSPAYRQLLGDAGASE
jgi:polar amino acid transport system substrate-binding protein